MSDYSEGGSETIAYFFVIIMTLGVIGPSLPIGPSDSIVNPFSCRDLEGTIVAKEHDEEGHKLYVQIYLEEWDGYIVFVSNNTYHAYEVGYTYEQRTCDLLEYEDILNTLDEMIDKGVFIPT
jgi:hypothetical protein